MAKGFGTVPNALSLDLSVSPLSVRLYLRIVHHRGGNGACWASQKDLSSELGVTDRSIRHCLKQLVAGGYISAEFRVGKTLKCAPTPEAHVRGEYSNPGSQLPHPRKLISAPPEVSFRQGKSNKQPVSNKSKKTAVLDFQEAYDLKTAQHDLDTVVEAWADCFGPFRSVGNQVKANILARLKEWTVDELVRAVKGYAKATAKWRGQGKSIKKPSKFFGEDENIQQYIDCGADSVPVDQLPKLMQILVKREFANVHAHREALTQINAQVDAKERSGSEVMNAINESHGSVDQLLERLERTTT